MKLEQIYTGCIAEAAYYITSNGQAAIVDPLRETQPYLDRLDRDGVKLKYIFETHFHADFVSGHVDLAKKTMGKIKFNVAFCLSVKVILMILGIAGYISLWEAVLIGDMGITLLVVGNSLLLAK